MDYVWDYGTLDVVDEKSYIASIVSTTFSNLKADVLWLMVETIYSSQHCIYNSHLHCAKIVQNIGLCKNWIAQKLHYAKIVLCKKSHCAKIASCKNRIAQKSHCTKFAHDDLKSFRQFLSCTWIFRSSKKERGPLIRNNLQNEG